MFFPASLQSSRRPPSATWQVGGILDYAAEAKDGELPEVVKPIDEEASGVAGAGVGGTGGGFGGEVLGRFFGEKEKKTMLEMISCGLETW